MTSRLIVDRIEGSTGGGNIITVPAGNTLVAPGHVLQVVSATDGSYNAVSVGAGSTTNWLSATITRKVATSKILILFSGNYGQGSGVDTGTRLYSSLDGRVTAAEGNSATNGPMKSIVSVGTDRGQMGAYYMENASFNFLHAPSVNSLAAGVATFSPVLIQSKISCALKSFCST